LLFRLKDESAQVSSQSVCPCFVKPNSNGGGGVLDSDHLLS